LNKQQDDGRRHIPNFAKKKKEKQNETCHDIGADMPYLCLVLSFPSGQEGQFHLQTDVRQLSGTKDQKKKKKLHSGT
jgi:hypothetical protein